ncbi:hypothetical protein B0H19DRAFT_1101013 [Mycena capillaripes]|nr:hypothetical protein B0H19DRAFT_1101013 [Mycena capillaripes]
MLVSNILHPQIDKNKLVVLKVSNRILACTDIPPRTNTFNTTALFGDVEYPLNTRYTLQWLIGTAHQQRDLPNNMDAAFKFVAPISARNNQTKLPAQKRTLERRCLYCSCSRTWPAGVCCLHAVARKSPVHLQLYYNQTA